MMNPESAARSIGEKLKEWRQDAPLIVGLEGYSGLGKTTIAKLVARIPGVKVISMDDFATTANTKESLMPQTKKESKTLSLEWNPPDGIQNLRHAIQDFRANDENSILVVEGIFLYHPDLDDVWDKRIYLEGNRDQADTRRVAREQERWGGDYFPETHPDSYTRLFKIAYRRYEELYDPRGRADLIIKAD